MFINHIEGKVVETTPASVVLESGGVGYYIKIPVSTYEQLKKDRIRLLISMIFKNEVIELYGFYTEEERNYFESLLKVRGIGGETALRILSSMNFYEFKEVVDRGDVDSLAEVRGIGRKRAEKIVFELKGLFKEEIIPNEALSALISLGFTRKEAKRILLNVVKSVPQGDLEMLIKEALKNT
ncbi:MAG: Holliday junction branch migration protein RuvA [bacterium (Candidatus Stahlbacteria) CG08_land_8_20_14_0_20_40_26]|nr:MAG: Holliday junction branch migration protein RuvA [bacterium (Candidatus Stahlbacteria) CG23_combo_of_CG06-09_8_20_14_all_40_9]PIS23709.1 MAG: Holliday junction branch migration protein RuvA [bacterium (Candidatus Stahlbacteria) CG08_land_8_20_14_0_20_40_26]